MPSYRRILSLFYITGLLGLFQLLPQWAWAQPDVPLTFTSDLPKNLFSAKTAVLISAASNLPEETGSGAGSSYAELVARLQHDNQQLGLNLVDFTDGSLPTTNALAERYQELQVQNLLILHAVNIVGLGAQATYLLIVTPFNGTASLLTPRQKAYSIQTGSYEELIQTFAEQAYEAVPTYFRKGIHQNNAANTAFKWESMSSPPAAVPSNPATAQTQRQRYPEVNLILQESQLGSGGGQHNFYYRLGGKEEKNAGFWGQRLRRDIGASEEAMVHLNRYRNAKTNFLVNRLLFVSAIAAYGFEANRSHAYFNDRQKLYLGAIAATTGLRFLVTRKTNTHMRRAVEEYNAFAASRNLRGWLPPLPDQLHLGLLPSLPNVAPAFSVHWFISDRP